MRFQFTATIYMKYMYMICAFVKLTHGRNYFYLHCGFESHDGNTKDDLQHCPQEYHIKCIQVFKDESLKFPPNHPREAI